MFFRFEILQNTIGLQDIEILNSKLSTIHSRDQKSHLTVWEALLRGYGASPKWSQDWKLENGGWVTIGEATSRVLDACTRASTIGLLEGRAFEAFFVTEKKLGYKQISSSGGMATWFIDRKIGYMSDVLESDFEREIAEENTPFHRKDGYNMSFVDGEFHSNAYQSIYSFYLSSLDINRLALKSSLERATEFVRQLDDLQPNGMTEAAA